MRAPTAAAIFVAAGSAWAAAASAANAASATATVATAAAATAAAPEPADATPAAADDDADEPDCDAPHRLAGIDVSSYQGVVDWTAVKRSGVAFAFARVSDGVAVVDERFDDNFRAMKRAGIRRGAYQHFRASVDPEEQADLFVDAVHRHGRADLPLVADVETNDGMEPDDVRARLARWLRRVERRTHARAIVYTSPSMSDTLGEEFADRALWIAHYEVDCPTVPAGWKRWLFWQRSATGHVGGVAGPVDLDVFAGTEKDLRRLLRR